MNSKIFFQLLLITTPGIALAGMEKAQSNAIHQKITKPNVIIIMTDDQGYGDLSCHGNPILKTPNLDRLHAKSLRFTDFHATPMCTPTRGQLLTGRDAARNGAINVSSGRTLLRTELPSIADLFSFNGYRTGIFGKWHLGDNYPFRPEDRGFQETLWFPSSHIGSVADFWGNDYFDDTYNYNGRREKFQGYCTDIFFDHAMQWMQKCSNDEVPFLVYLPTNTPHYPMIAPEADILEMEKVFLESDFKDMAAGLKKNLIRFLAMIRNIDMNVGRLVAFLEEEGIGENTILIFTTDNGSTYGPRYFNAGMRGMKTELYEGGHRVPFFISRPEGLNTPPRDIKGLTQVQDILPTLVELCKLKISKNIKFDGISLASVLQGKKEVDSERVLLINYSRMPVGFDFPSPAAPSILKRNGAGVLWKSWRLLEDSELYNLENDPLQQKNVIDQEPEVVKKMRSFLNNWWEDVKEVANEPQRVIIGNEKENPSVLTACEWMDVFVDQQFQIKRGIQRNSYWELFVDQPGEYEFELRRWPREADAPLIEALSGGKALPITSARIFISGVNHVKTKIPMSFEGENKKVMPGDKKVVFNVLLNAGPVTLQTWFDDANNNSLCGAYYVYVNRK